ncbi:uncharacterized protein LOC113505422 [Trichoplusia ni]|uniref:Uncharacterized protein LOC113505422 n=1 Tax=Trichoplusia ni TaxID=7111 RepID=A0A7E5WSV0_TRINI|nr:uncharacterized protein LOC113505422 [Trichoplusia ni]
MNGMLVEQEPLGKGALDALSEEEARAERKRRQRLAQEEFRLKQLVKQQPLDDKQELGRNSSSFDKLLMDIPTQDIMIEDTGEEPSKRKSPAPDGNSAKRRNTLSKLDIVQTK